MNIDVFQIAHEVKNPLCVVKGYMEMLNDKNWQKYKKIINTELDNSIMILNSYLEYKKLKLECEIMDINLLLTEIEERYTEYLKSLGITLHININDDENYIWADYNKLRQVLDNIIKNSIESQSKNIFLDYEIDLEKVLIKIKDDGEKAKNISLIGDSYSDKVLGNGIGLNLCRKIIELHHGKMELKNDLDGFSVYITLLIN